MAPSQSALLLERTGGAFYKGTRPVPKPGSGELMVKIKAFALNPIDWKLQDVDFSGSFMKEAKFPAVIGSDIAGDVEEIGEGVHGWNKGERMYGYLPGNDYTAFQQYALVPADLAIRIPENTSYEQASTIPVAYMAAAFGLLGPEPSGAGLVDSNTLEPKGNFADSAAVVIGGTTSVGQFVIQLLKYVGFGQIIAYASGHQSAFLQSLGATDIIDRKKIDLDQLPNAVSSLSKLPRKLVYDAVGISETQTIAAACIPDGETICSSFPIKVVDLGNSGKKFFAPLAVSHLPDWREFGKVVCGRLGEWVNKGIIKPPTVELLPPGFEAVIEGLDRLRNNKVSGVKLVGRPDSA
ncbi:hypothetical protein D9757_010999 [Collybiopsis confluens]|uniref:Enoyl reductase (ER) domain-containing protein n=1 Tax=Collybiopsis confluens TaxID=2823264 RepID=A0A8H5GDH4_9AGAR|nr:hypothetical protein D9757_010999 [Collybiopsis confluens]